MATIKDVAELAGLSVTLVSRYLNNLKGVSPASKEKIRAAIKTLNYRPNGIARSLVLQKTHSIGIVLNNLCAPFVSRLVAGLEQGSEEFNKVKGYNVLFCSSNGDLEKKQQQVRFLTQGRVDGIIIYGSLSTDDTIIEQLAASDFPFLLIENDVKDIEANKVLIDNVNGAYRATEHLILQGYKRIAHMTGNMNLKITLDRMNGYILALQNYNIPVEESLILYPDFTNNNSIKPKNDYLRGDSTYYDAGYIEMKKLLARKERLPDAIFFATDISAFGAIKAMEEVGLHVPEDIAIMGFDDEYPSDYGCDCKPISTMHQPLQEAGYFGIKSLIRNLEHPELEKEKIVLKTELIIRDSCCRKK